MKTKRTALKSSSIVPIAAALLALSGQASANDVSHLIWAGHFKEAYDSATEQTESTSIRSGAYSSAKDTIIWAGHFERAYGPPSQRIGVVTGPGRFTAVERLLWAGHFEHAYQPIREEALPESGSTEVAMHR